MAPDGRMFQTSNRKGELFELKQGLNATTVKERKNALKRTVAAMSLGRDMSSLFPDVVKNTTGDLSMKKLVYLYIINYANANADLSILIVNTFIKDAADPNPLLRALAIRTMALVPLEKITEYLCAPLHSALQDRDPYVRKTAAVCVAKLYDTNPTLAVEEGFVTELQQLLSDSNAMTVANAVASIAEIADASQQPSLLPLTDKTVPRFLSALSECTEWGQVFILDAIVKYVPGDAKEADMMVERVIPRLQHANAAVVLSSICLIIALMPCLDSDDKRSFLIKKMSAPLITLLSGPPELQFTVLRNVDLLIRAYPSLLSGDVRVLFASYSDPPYVKREKLDVLTRIADGTNCDDILSELIEYSGDVDVAFARKAIDCIGRIAIRLASKAERCVDIISELLSRKIPHVTEQAAIAVQNIMRAYPKHFPALVSQLCEAVDDVDDPEAKVALLWVIGEHADELPSAVQLLQVVASGIAEESVHVQLQLLTACVKALLLRGAEAESVTQSVIQYATTDCDNLDVRDRGFLYSRVVSLGADVARRIVLCQKPPVIDSKAKLPEELHKELLGALSTVAAVYHKPCKSFEGKKRKSPFGLTFGEAMPEEDLLGLDEGDGGEILPHQSTPVVDDKPVGTSMLDDLLGLPSNVEATPKSTGAADDVLSSSLGLGSLAIATAPSQHQQANADSLPQLLSGADGKGLEICGGLTAGSDGSPALALQFRNVSNASLSEFAVQLNKNAFGFVPQEQLVVDEPLGAGAQSTTQVALATDESMVDNSKQFSLQTAVKFSPGGVVYFGIDTLQSIGALLDRSRGPLAKPDYLALWSRIPDAAELKSNVQLGAHSRGSLDASSQLLRDGGVCTVAKRASATPPVLYLSARLMGRGSDVVLAELTMPRGSDGQAMIASRTAGSIGHARMILVQFNRFCARVLST